MLCEFELCYRMVIQRNKSNTSKSHESLHFGAHNASHFKYGIVHQCKKREWFGFSLNVRACVFIFTRREFFC